MGIWQLLVISYGGVAVEKLKTMRDLDNFMARSGNVDSMVAVFYKEYKELIAESLHKAYLTYADECKHKRALAYFQEDGDPEMYNKLFKLDQNRTLEGSLMGKLRKPHNLVYVVQPNQTWSCAPDYRTFMPHDSSYDNNKFFDELFARAFKDPAHETHYEL